ALPTITEVKEEQHSYDSEGMKVAQTTEGQFCEGQQTKQDRDPWLDIISARPKSFQDALLKANYAHAVETCDPQHLPDDLKDPKIAACLYMTSAQEEEYLANLDMSLRPS